ncbi:MAG: hypothetical protein HUK22_03930, partial [Thermoguttaceae bacterium]|nr:hypothetical protein [Thermoguttaceae bacterium]
KNEIKPVALDGDRIVRREYPSDLARAIDKRAFAGCKTTAAGAAIVVEGAFDDVARIEYEIAILESGAQRRATEARRAADADESGANRGKIAANQGKTQKKVVSGRVENKRLGDLFAYLEDCLGVSFALSPELTASGVGLETRTTCDFRNADAEKTASIIANKIGAAYKIDGGVITFIPKRR